MARVGEALGWLKRGPFRGAWNASAFATVAVCLLALAGCQPPPAAAPPTVVVVPERGHREAPAPAPAPAGPSQRSVVVAPPPTFRARQKKRRPKRQRARMRDKARHAALIAKTQPVRPTGRASPEPKLVVDSPTLINTVDRAPAPPPSARPVRNTVEPRATAARPVPAPVAAKIETGARERAWRDAAESLAAAVEQSVRRHGRKYDRSVLRRFQQVARLVVDGIYGPGSAGALRYFLDRAPPAHFLNTGVRERKYTAPAPAMRTL